MTYNSGQFPTTGGFPGTGTGRHRSVSDEPGRVDLTKPTFIRTEAYSAQQPLDNGAEAWSEESVDSDGAADEQPGRHPWVLASIVGITVFVATAIIGGTLWAVSDSKVRKAENYATGPPASTVTVTESVTTTATTTVTSRPSRSARPSDPYSSEEASPGATTASSGWYAQFGSFTSLESAQDLAAKVGGEVYRGEEFGQPGQYVVAQREYSRTGAREACDVAEQSCIVKQVQ